MRPKPQRQLSTWEKRPSVRRRAMTVCIAAIAERNTIIGISDRMLTAGDIEFEPEQAKFWEFSNSIYALLAGDAGIQAGILRQVDIEVKKWVVEKGPQDWIRVREVVDLYVKKYRQYRKEMAEATILTPLGLTIENFFEKQKDMNTELVGDIANRLTSFELPGVIETIILGIDTDGPLSDKEEKLNYAQLYSITDDRYTWLTTVGFAAIGIGKSHAESQFMFSGHWTAKSFSDTLLLAYAAKKRAEAAPGVGKETDVFILGPGRGYGLKVEEKHLLELDAIYQKNRKASIKAVERAKGEARVFVDRVRAEYAAIAKKKEEEKDKNE